MMESMSNALVIPVDVRKLSDGIQQIFIGCASVFDSLGAQLDKGMLPNVGKLEFSENGKVEQETGLVMSVPEEKKAGPEITSAADRSETERLEKEKTVLPSKDPEDQTYKSTVTVNDIIRIASAKITANRKNSDKIQNLIATYGASKLSELPEEKYEAFLTDISQL